MLYDVLCMLCDVLYMPCYMRCMGDGVCSMMYDI